MVRVPDTELVYFFAQAESADDAFQFRGPKKPCLKECVLIINTDTGEAILEKISNTMQLKAIRYTFIRGGEYHMTRTVTSCKYSLIGQK